MDIKTMFPNLSLMWSRWSEYEIVRRMDNGIEKEYIVPVPGAEQIIFNCAEHPEPMVADAIGIGEQICKNEIPVKQIQLLCTNFASRYGLLGQMVGADLTKIYSTAPVYYALNCENYGEELSYFQGCLQKLYCHFMTIQGKWSGKPQNHDWGLYGTLHYRLTPGKTPQLVWGIDRMESVLWLTYASLVTEEKSGLKICKNCGKIYYNSHAKSEFCGPKCRNRYNVRAFRERENSR